MKASASRPTRLFPTGLETPRPMEESNFRSTRSRTTHLLTIHADHRPFPWWLASGLFDRLLQILDELIGHSRRQSLSGDMGYHLPQRRLGEALTVHAMCTAAGEASPFKCQPRVDMMSPTSITLTFGSMEPNATTVAMGSPRTYSSGISSRIAFSMLFAHSIIDLQDFK
jgi:hypothetical protein